MTSDKFKNFKRLVKEGFTEKDAYINSSDEPEKTKKRLESKKEEGK